MNQPMQIDPAAIDAAGSQLASVAQEMADSLTTLQSTVTGSGNPWGGDEQGTLFAQVYGVVLSKAIESIGSHVQQIFDASSGLAQQAQLYRGTESDITAQQTSLANGIGG